MVSPIQRLRILFYGSLATLLGVVSVGCYVYGEYDYAPRYLELRPRPTDEAIEQFREQFPATKVTTTQPNSWNKIELGMTRDMVRALVGDRLIETQRSVATLKQDMPSYEKQDVRLYFTTTGTTEGEDILRVIIVRGEYRRPMQSTDWP